MPKIGEEIRAVGTLSSKMYRNAPAFTALAGLPVMMLIPRTLLAANMTECLKLIIEDIIN